MDPIVNPGYLADALAWSVIWLVVGAAVRQRIAARDAKRGDGDRAR